MTLSPYSQDSAAAAPGQALTGNPARDLANSFNIRVIAFLGLHVPLVFAMEFSPWFSTAHALAVLLFGLRAGLLGRRSQVLYAVSYIAACEVVWRMTRAHLFWEYAKYAIVLVAFVALAMELRQRGGSKRLRTALPLLLLASLVPAAVLAVLEVGVAEARDPLSFNLAPYLVLVVVALYVWARPIGRDTTTRAMLAIMAPVAGITALAVYYTIRSLGTFTFTANSNWLTSGSFGPNQVSNMMGLGALAGVMLLVLMPRARGARAFVLLLTIAMLAQGMLTFSRGGVYSFLLAVAVFGFHILTSRKARGRFLVLTALSAFVLVAVIYPSLDTFTNGSLSERFRDTDTTGRLEAAQADLAAFRDNPLVGVGAGQADAYHEQYLGFALAAHTEFTRLLAEHGLFGILVMGIMGWMVLRRYVGNDAGLGRAMTAAMAVWSLSVMVHSAMRLAAIPFILALALAQWRLEVTAEAAPEVEAPVARPLIVRSPREAVRTR